METKITDLNKETEVFKIIESNNINSLFAELNKFVQKIEGTERKYVNIYIQTNEVDTFNEYKYTMEIEFKDCEYRKLKFER